LSSGSNTKRGKVFDFVTPAVLNGLPPSNTPRKNFPLSKPEEKAQNETNVTVYSRTQSANNVNTTATYLGQLGGLSTVKTEQIVNNLKTILDDESSSSDSSSDDDAIKMELQTASSLATKNEPIDTNVENDQVVIHVYDETNHINKDFKCSREILLQEMKYFRTYLTDKSSLEDVDIAVHCDVNIFQWLVNYMNLPRKEVQLLFGKLDVSWAISILISSFFLGMDDLVQSTIDFVREKLQEIINLPIELDCMNEHLIEQLAQKFSDEELENIRDRKDKIVGRLFQKKIEQLLTRDDGANTLLRCSVCDKLYTNKQAQWATCLKAPIHIDYHGQVISKHVPHQRWNVNMYLVNLKKRCNLTWREIYWRCWGLVHTFSCLRCKNNFAGADYGRCTYHKKDPVFERGANAGVYPCCNMQALRFDSGLNVKNGCCEISHTFERNEYTDLLHKYQHLIVSANLEKEMSYIRGETHNEENHDESEGSDDSTAENTDEEENETDHDYGNYDEDEDEDDDYYSDEDLMPDLRINKYEIFHSFSRRPEEVIKPQVEKKEGRKKRKKNSGFVSGGSGGIDFDGAPNSKKRYQVLDNQRETDRKNMNDIIWRLTTFRKDTTGLIRAKPAPPSKAKKRPTTAKATTTKNIANNTKRQSFRI
jgi:hypothetical protein